MTREESILSSIKFLRDTAESARAAVMDVIWPWHLEHMQKLEALAEQLSAATDVPESVMTAAREAVEHSKSLLNATDVLVGVPVEVDAKLAELTPPSESETDNG